MSVITFWSQGNVETGKTMSMVAIATYLAIEHNYRILLVNTKFNNTDLQECFWEQSKNNKKVGADLGTGISGLSKAIASNKTAPEIITNYTQTIFKDRLELLTDDTVSEEEYNKQKLIMGNIIKMASKYYDLVFVDLEGYPTDVMASEILEFSNLVVINLTQKLKDINDIATLKAQNKVLSKGNTMCVIGRYDKFSKYNSKNVSTYTKEQDIFGIPYNTLFFEACSEGQTADFFINFRMSRLKPGNVQTPFITAVGETATRIIEKLKELQMGMY